jgi:penicillin-binding protein 1A
MGIETDLPEVPSLALGVSNISLLQLSKAYACLDNEGRRVEPNYLIRIEDANGKVLKKFPRNEGGEQVISPENAAIITHFLKSVVNEGTGSDIRSKYNIEGDFAGKTGTTQNYADGWFMGYTPDLVTGCWVGGEEPSIHFRNIALGRGGYTALPIVGKFFNKLYRDPSFSDWRFHNFSGLPEETLALLNVPHYKDDLQEKGLFNLWGLFGSNEKNKPDQKTEKKEDNSNQPSASAKTEERRDDKPSNIWDKIRDALKKK